MKPLHPIPPHFRTRPVVIDLVGVGGTGSRLLTALAELHVGLVASGHPHGLQVTAWDPDTVSESNIGRTAFAPSDVGQLKAAVLMTRVNLVFGTYWHASAQEYEHPYWHMQRCGAPPDLVITCVDTLQARAKLYRQMLTAESEPPTYWLDCGNADETGQVVLGEPEWLGDPRRFERRRRTRLRHVVDLFPGMLEAADQEVPEGPSCTQAVALGLQGLPINRMMADGAQLLLWRLFRDGGLNWNGLFVNARTGRTNPISIEGTSPATLPATALPEAATRIAPARRRLRAAPRDRARAA